MRKTKIICTIGPVSEAKDQLRELILNGMNVARLNFSHGDHDEQGNRITLIKELREELNIPVAMLLDTKGPEIRLKSFKEGKVQMKTGQKFTFTSREVEGDTSICTMTYEHLPLDVNKGDRILIDDGLVEFEVVSTTETDILCICKNDGTIGNKKGVNVPGVKLRLPALTNKDRGDIEFGVKSGVDFIAASFIRKADDVLEIRTLLEKHDAVNTPIIAKIENQEGIDNIDDIIEAADAIMVARGDLGVETDPEMIPIHQKRIIEKCNKAGKPVITATQMLDSMIRNPRPTRAETTDVANAIIDGTDAIMLSGETAAGDYPVQALQTMVRIAKTTEAEYGDRFFKVKKKLINNHVSITNSVSYSTCTTAMALDAKAVVTTTSSGYTARMVSKFRPKTPIIAATMSEKVARSLNIVWGVTPIVIEEKADSSDLFKDAINAAKEKGFLENGDVVVTTAGVPVGMAGSTNTMSIYTVGEIYIKGAGLGARSVTSKVCIADNFDTLAGKFTTDEIIVMKEVDEKILTYLSNVAGIIFEAKASEVSREIVQTALKYNVPVIAEIEDATTALRDGQIITMDARKGLVFTGKM